MHHIETYSPILQAIMDITISAIYHFASDILIRFKYNPLCLNDGLLSHLCLIAGVSNIDVMVMGMKSLILATLVSIVALISIAIAAPVQEHIDSTSADIQSRALEDIVQGNLTQDHISQEVNATKDRLTNQALEHINQSLNITSEQLEQRAKEELKNQVNQKVQQPGFEYAFALAGILGAAIILRRRY
jgi:PGF-CTERM protein